MRARAVTRAHLGLERLGELPPAKLDRVFKDGAVRVDGHATLGVHAPQQRAALGRVARDRGDELVEYGRIDALAHWADARVPRLPLAHLALELVL